MTSYHRGNKWPAICFQLQKCCVKGFQAKNHETKSVIILRMLLKKKIHQAKFLFAENWMGRMFNSFWICRLAVFVNIIYRFIFEPYIY